ncbi:MAG: Mg2 transporter protein CorA family protein [Mycobacterium sp.]|nr:Mg2 transporter protein CorA family protein [Mycobacterium sp.]MCW2746362.1 Mg2 transporter protein CorA family protein [Mycobacterium sp.]
MTTERDSSAPTDFRRTPQSAESAASRPSTPHSDGAPPSLAPGSRRDIGGAVRRDRVYRNGALEAEGFDVARISDYLGEDGTVVWLDLCEPALEDLQVLADEFGLNPLAVEDAVSERQRPKLDRYSDHVFLSVYGIRLDEAGELHTSEIAAFASPRFLITVRKDGHFDMDRVVAAWDNSKDLSGHGVGYLLWGLLDTLVDDHFTAVQALDEDADELEGALFDERPRSKEVQRRSFQMRKSLVGLRRVVLPMREVVNSLLRRDIGLVAEPMLPYYQDVYDHVLRAAEWTESLRDLVSTILETNLTIQGNRLNEVMKRLTSYAAIIAVPTAVTGFYGQNVPYPGFQSHWGFAASISIMLGSMAVLFLVFRRKGWL